MKGFNGQRVLLASAIAAILFPAAIMAASADDVAGQGAQTSSTPQTKVGGEKQEEPTELSAITVTGLRQSLQGALQTKRDDKMVVDSIIATDIGKLPDNSVADALQRVPGVQVAQGDFGETTNVLVRGLPNVTTTFNGRQVFNAFGRQLGFQDIPSSAVAGLDVFKTQDATMVGGGIAGTVNIRTFRPFDFDGFKVAGTFDVDRSKLADKDNLNNKSSQYGGAIDPSGSVLISDRWNTGLGDIGALINVSVNSQHFNYPVAFNDFWGSHVLTDAAQDPFRLPNGDLVNAPNNTGNFSRLGYRKRPEMNYALQWKPSDNSEIYLEGMYTWDQEQRAISIAAAQYNRGGDTTYDTFPSKITVGRCWANQSHFKDPMGNDLFGETICAPTSATYSGNFPINVDNQVLPLSAHNYFNALGGKWHSDKLTLSTEVSIIRSESHDAMYNPSIIVPLPSTIDWNYPQVWHVDPVNADSNPNNWYLNNFSENWHEQTAKQDAWRADGNYNFGDGLFRSLDFGVRYAQDTADQHGANFSGAPLDGSFLPGSSTQVNPANNVYNLFGASFFCKQNPTASAPSLFPSACYQGVLAQLANLRALTGAPAGGPPASPDQFYHFSEKNYSLYAQVNYGGALAGIPFDGVVGIREQKDDRSYAGFNTIVSAAGDVSYSPNTGSVSTTTPLPNASFNLHLRKDLQLRLVAGKTLSYPDYGNLRPTLNLSPPTTTTSATGSGGNPNLQPTRSTNFDTSLEWYFAEASALTGGLFYRDVTGYIQTYSVTQNVGGVPYLINEPVNTAGGHLKGAEFAYTQFFDFLPEALSGLGAQFNFTYIDGSVKAPNPSGPGFFTTPFQNVSPHNYNATLMYEKYGLSARLAYDFRSRYVGGFTGTTPIAAITTISQYEPNRLDLSVAYDVDRYLTVVFTATNLTGSNFTQYAGPGKDLPIDIRYVDKTLALGVRFKL